MKKAQPWKAQWCTFLPCAYQRTYHVSQLVRARAALNSCRCLAAFRYHALAGLQAA